MHAGRSNRLKIHEASPSCHGYIIPHLLNTKNSFYSITLFTLFTLFYSVSWDYIYVELALFYKGIRPFLTGRSPSI
jgi:hypothetical protein